MDMKNIAHWGALSFKLPTVIALFLLYQEIGNAVAGGSIPEILDLSMPPSHIALSGDLHLKITSPSFPPLLLQLSRLEGNIAQPLTTFPVYPEARALSLNTTIVKIPCGYFSRVGQYYILIKKQPIGNTTTITNPNNDDNVIMRSLDVRWPMPQLTLTPENVQTYPETPVSAILEFPDVKCAPMADSAPSAIPEFWLELHYCGHSLLTCDNDSQNRSVQVLYTEQVRGFPGQRMFTLRCELFGLAGYYALYLKPTSHDPPFLHTTAYIKADWSEQFVFNVHARSIFPCDTHNGGIKVLFQYPSCILASGDRIRLFARLRANVASLAPPTSLEYVAEQRFERGQHTLHFDCDLFTEHYVEYCFVYVSQAITGAVADVRMDCVPTLPVSESESGGWGPWTAWTPCSSTCIGGIRSRYRFCDSPPPRYGAKFCEGKAVETEKCGKQSGTTPTDFGWECFYGNALTSEDVAAEIPEIQAEIGPYCRCGCVVHLGHAKPKRLLATSSQSCPGRTFWLIQADGDHIIQFKVGQFYLPCGTQWLKVRDGSSLSSTLLADLSGAPDTMPFIVNSTGSNLLLEFFSDEIPVGGQICGGGFLAHATQIKSSNISGIPIAQSVGVLPSVVLKLTAVHIAAIFFLSGLIIASALLGAQYLFRYRKYHIAQGEDQDSLADPAASCASISARTRASSNATLLSEVISLTRLRPHIKTNRNKHSRLRESLELEHDEEDERDDDRDDDDDDDDNGDHRHHQQVTLAKEEESLSSTTTLTQQETTLTTNVLQYSGDIDDITCSLPSSPQNYETTSSSTLRRSSTLSEKDKSREKDELKTTTNVSNKMMTHVRASSENISKSDPGFYSPALSQISRATIRSTNAKETKDKRNREKLLAVSAGSDFSLGIGDLELDYYDYNVVNAGAAPGSYLGMDPAFLVWIPPLDEGGEILPEDHEMQIIKSYGNVGSNQETPEEEEKKSLLPSTIQIKVINNDNNDNNSDNELLENDNKIRKMKELRKLSIKSKIIKDMEKETEVEKSPTMETNNILDEIKYVDDDEDLTEIQCNISYQDSNILSSN